MTDVIVIERCCYCLRNLSTDKLVYNESRDLYYCADTDECRAAQAQQPEQPATSAGSAKGAFSSPYFQLHYRQAGCGRALAGAFVGVAVFFGSWGYAVKSYGWFLGLGLGWIPAFFLGVMAAMFWPAAILVILAILLFSR